jgi:hypothetical protein
MNKSQNRSMVNRRMQGNMFPPKVNIHTVKDLGDSERDETSVSKFKRMIRIFKELKEVIQKEVNDFQVNMDKKFEKVQKQLNELKEHTNKHQNEIK